MEGGIKQGFKVGRLHRLLELVAFQQDFQNYIEFTFGFLEAEPPGPPERIGFQVGQHRRCEGSWSGGRVGWKRKDRQRGSSYFDGLHLDEARFHNAEPGL